MDFSTVLILMLYGGIALIEIPPLRKQKDKRKLILYTVLLAFSASISVLIGIGIELPSPSDPIKHIVTSIFGK